MYLLPDYQLSALVGKYHVLLEYFRGGGRGVNTGDREGKIKRI